MLYKTRARHKKNARVRCFNFQNTNSISSYEQKLYYLNAASSGQLSYCAKLMLGYNTSGSPCRKIVKRKLGLKFMKMVENRVGKGEHRKRRIGVLDITVPAIVLKVDLKMEAVNLEFTRIKSAMAVKD